MKPFVEEITFIDPITAFALFGSESGAVLFDSVTAPTENAHYSFIAVDPWDTMVVKNQKDNPFTELKTLLAQFKLETIPDLPPWQGGVAGYFGYHLCHYLESIPRQKLDDMEFPDIALGFYDVVVGFDHHRQKAWIISSGFPEKEEDKRQKRAIERCHWLKDRLKEAKPLSPLSKVSCSPAVSNFSQPDYEEVLRRTIEYIYAGDIYQTNISRRFMSELPSSLTPFELYHRLRTINPAPFAAFLNFGDVQIASASPERFLKLSQGVVDTRPIKGTRRRGATPEEDQKAAQELIDSKKDQAENVMIVDLMRNDLSRVCLPGTVQVPSLLALESFATVHHLVSTVTGKLRPELGAVDLLEATFPGGSITGTPKIRAMEIIAEMEPTQRGPYCGAIGYIGFDGTMDTNIVIRTYAIKDNIITFQAGGGIVADSDPTDEYHETTAKAAALIRGLGK